MTADEAVSLSSQFPGLGLVLYPSNIQAARHLDVPAIAYVTSEAHARAVASMAWDGVPFLCAIVMDERNHSGPSGSYMEPDDYTKRFTPIYDILREARVKTHTMGMMAVGGFWRIVFRNRKFDDAYHSQLPFADGRGFNPNQVRYSEVNRVLRSYEGPWLLSPAPFRGWWDHIWSPIKTPGWLRISERNEVRAVAFWCLREVWGGEYFGNRWQSEHGLLDRHGDMTKIGKQVHAYLTSRVKMP